MSRHNSARRSACGAARAAVLFSVVLLTTSLAGLSSGEIIAVLDQNPAPGIWISSQSYSLDFVNSQQGIIVGDKKFDTFTVVTTKSKDALAPGIDEIHVTPVSIFGDLGFKFNSGWSAFAGQIADSTIQFHASILPEYVALGYAFKDNNLYITGFGTDQVYGLVSVSENLYHDYPSPISTPFANKYVFYKSDTQNKYVDQRTFAPVTEMWIVKDVVANGGIAGSGGSAHISEFYQTFSQVPEPGSLALLFAGALGLVGFAFRRRFV